MNTTQKENKQNKMFDNKPELSNQWQGKVVIRGREYPNGEAAFQGSKYYELSLITTDIGRKYKLINEAKTYQTQSTTTTDTQSQSQHITNLQR